MLTAAADAINTQEAGILKGLNYDRNIVQFYGACIRRGVPPLLVTEYMEGAHCSCCPVRWHSRQRWERNLASSPLHCA
jgi:serine/threonine protein kinase